MDLDLTLDWPGDPGCYGPGDDSGPADHDDKGISWPVPVAPWEVVLTVLKSDDSAVANVAATLYDELGAAGIDVILDDRDERPGVKFNDAELVGIPYRVTIGSRGVADDELEVVRRATGEVVKVPIGRVTGHLVDTITTQRTADLKPD